MIIAFTICLLLFYQLDVIVEGFVFKSTRNRFEALVLSTVAVDGGTESFISSSSQSTFRNEPLSSPNPRDFEWWNEACDAYLDDLDRTGGERFVASHDVPDETGHTRTNNWLHVTSSNPDRRVQYEIRYVDDGVDGKQIMGGVVRFGEDCEGPEHCAHGGSIASVADALTATCCFKASKRWGMTTRLECNYREAIPLGMPVKVEATVVDLKKRKASLEWNIYSFDQVDRNGQPLRHAFGCADFLLPRTPKD